MQSTLLTMLCMVLMLLPLRQLLPLRPLQSELMTLQLRVPWLDTALVSAASSVLLGEERRAANGASVSARRPLALASRAPP